jgi:hypothetical protein
LIGVLVLVSGCASSDTTTVVKTKTVSTGTSDQGSQAPTQTALTTHALFEEIAAGHNPAYLAADAFECTDPTRTTPASEALACMAELRRWYAERRDEVGSVAKWCVPFYRFVCIDDTGGDHDCREVLATYSNGHPVEVSKFADPLLLDEDHDGIGCEPYTG